MPRLSGDLSFHGAGADCDRLERAKHETDNPWATRGGVHHLCDELLSRDAEKLLLVVSV
jgi:hypothetical protein